MAHRSSDPHGAAAPASLTPPPVVLTAAADALPVTSGDRRAYPLVLAGMVTAVLEVETPIVDEDTEQVLSSLLSTAAAALESAHLHSTARELADIDGLTHLPNRRRFELDIDTEWERCRRYGRPISLVMMDLDHFKRLNDQHGHLLGDQVLREVATAIGEALRSTDTAYRYGGEEIVVLLRETGLEDAAAAAERLREAVAGVALAEHPEVTVSTSAGVARAALGDVALHRAGRQGRQGALRGQAARPRPGGGRRRAGRPRRRDAVPRRGGHSAVLSGLTAPTGGGAKGTRTPNSLLASGGTSATEAHYASKQNPCAHRRLK